jgi:hypothetical protein
MAESQQTVQSGTGTATISMPAPVPSVYFNGFEVNYSLSDMSMLLVLDGTPVVRLNLSFTTAKTLSAYLNSTVSEFERRTQHNIMSMDDVSSKLEKSSG